MKEASYQVQLLRDLRHSLMQEMRNIATSLVHKYNERPAVVALLSQYKVRNLMALAVSDYDAFLFDLRNLHEKIKLKHNVNA